ncbi:transcriptional activator HlyU [Candidatus Phycosocius bacilliformis]|uniref:Transcriptional activator HlyU n=1 Tax=Candidatus Phycosocius bacilliformis TaxID=1445552 RepID=A0A2P2E9T3_9PROT|nr:metalloregulator ArsR/SmtB family transcription factor [Candidatus Phycosocius bacilliformis]GBF57803.1 transcriptional activator HlyU [Candidatus Phycosocius bacilliformis]
MSTTADLDLAASAMAERAGDVAKLLKTIGNERRLLVLCTLVGLGEASAGTLGTAVGLSQSAMSQHLAVMREEGLVSTRRDGTTIFYAIADPKLAVLMDTLHQLYCSPHSA